MLDPKTDSRRFDQSGFTGSVLVGILALVAWWPALGSYFPITDDHPLSWHLPGASPGYFEGFYRDHGVWRILQYPLVGLALHHALGGLTFILVGLHMLVAIGLHRLALRLFSPPWALAAAALAATSPVGFQAILWLNAFPYTVGSLALLCLLILQIDAGKRRVPQAAAFTGSFLLALFSNALHEHLLASFAGAGAAQWLSVWSDEGRPAWRRWLRHHWSALGPAVGCIVFLLVYTLTKPPVDKMPIVFNPLAPLSALFHQYTQWWAYEPWLIPGLRSDFAWPHGSAAVWTLFAAAVLLAVGVADRALAARRVVAAHRMRPAFALVLIALLLVGAAAIYAAPGGYALDSRKKYPFVWLAFLGACWIGQQLPSTSRLAPAKPWILAGLVMVNTMSSWLMAGVWRHEFARYHQKVMEAHADAALLPEPSDLYSAWPHAELLWGERLDTEITVGLGASYFDSSLWSDEPAQIPSR